MRSRADSRQWYLLAGHWPEYGIEAALLGTFMLSACVCSALLFHPDSPVAKLLPGQLQRRVLMGLAMGATAVALNYSAWGKRSGAHYNPAVTLAFARLGKIARSDVLGYVSAQFAGAVAGVFLAGLIVREMLAHPDVHYAVTRPGTRGVAVAFLAEAVISWVLMTVVLTTSNRARLAPYTGTFAGLLVATFIVIEAPLSGMSMNPARTAGSGLWAHDWTAVWIYFTAPLLGMLLAAEAYLCRHGPAGVFCAKLHHRNEHRCIFCEFQGRGTYPRSAALHPPIPSAIQSIRQSKETDEMKRGTWIIGLAVVGGIGWYAFRPELLFVRKTVNESLPVAAAQATTSSSGGAVATTALVSGRFNSVAHETKGSATIYRLDDGRRVLRLTEFTTSNGPDVRVYLVAARDAADDETVTKAGFVELGTLKGTDGNQNYEVPADLDLEKYRAVTIWCRRFSVNFGTAPLTPAS